MGIWSALVFGFVASSGRTRVTDYYHCPTTTTVTSLKASSLEVEQQTSSINTSDVDAETIHGWLIRPAEHDDKEEAAQVIQQAFEETCREDYDPETLRIAAAMISKPQNRLIESGTWYVAEHPDSGHIVGCGGWCVEHKTGRASLQQFASDPNYPNSKIGSALWKKTKEDIQQEFHPEEQMEVVSTLTAKPFYEKVGFEPVKNVDVPILLKKFPSVVMRRKVVTTKD